MNFMTHFNPIKYGVKFFQLQTCTQMLCLSKLDTFDSNIVGILKNIVSTYFFSVICVWYCENIFVACHGQEMSLWKPRYGSSLIFKNERTNTHEDADICIVILSGILTQLHNIPREFVFRGESLSRSHVFPHSLTQSIFLSNIAILTILS